MKDRKSDTRGGFAGFGSVPPYKVWLLGIVCVVTLHGSGCAPLPPRPELSTVGCAAAIVRERIPAGLGDKQQHCLAAGLIARHCSRTEAWLIAAGKEIGDLLGHGDAEWADWQADRAGLRCAANDATDTRIMSCCSEYVGPTIGTHHPRGEQR